MRNPSDFIQSPFQRRGSPSIAPNVPLVADFASPCFCVVATDIDDIRNLLVQYQDAVNANDIDEIVDNQYGDDSIFIAPSPSRPSIGREAIRRAYQAIFLSPETRIVPGSTVLRVEEVVPTAPDWAFARLETEITVNMPGEQGNFRQIHQCMLILRKLSDERDAWRIARFVQT